MLAAGERGLPIPLIERSCPSLHQRAPAVKRRNWSRIDCDRICSITGKEQSLPVLLRMASRRKPNPPLNIAEVERVSSIIVILQTSTMYNFPEETGMRQYF